MTYMSGKDNVVLQGGDTNVKPVADFLLKEEFNPQGSPSLTVVGVDNEDGTGTFTVQAKDIDGNNLAGRFLIRTWRGATAYATDTAITGFAVATGTLLESVTDDADLEVITDATGKIVLTATDDGEHHVMATAGGPIYTGTVTVTS